MGSVIVPLAVDDLAVLRQRRSAKWRTYPEDVLPLTIAEMDFPIAEPVAEAMRAAVSRSDTGYAMPGHNPVGRVHDRGELEAVVRLAHEYGVRVISNEIHAPLVLPGAAFTPVLTVPGAAEIAVSLVSASKAWNLAGLKCATIVAGSPAMRAVTGQLPPERRWRIGHFGVLATIAAFTAGQAHQVAALCG
jgi:bifunctional pyridoxal-dependent enzyme with beta-cystathionase and maltose regulon repressor activities